MTVFGQGNRGRGAPLPGVFTRGAAPCRNMMMQGLKVRKGRVPREGASLEENMLC